MTPPTPVSGSNSPTRKWISRHWKDARSQRHEIRRAYAAPDRRPNSSTFRGDGNYADFLHEEISHFQHSRAIALTALAVIQTRNGNLDAAAASIDAAYDDAKLGQLQGPRLQDVINVGANIADARGNAIDIAKWTARAVMTPSHDSPKN